MTEPAGTDASHSAIVHATTICMSGRALLLQGASGAGKSALALQCIGLGARLVADDRTQLARRGARLFASPPKALEGLIEARGIGLLRLPFDTGVPVCGVVDLDTPETGRLPAAHTTALLGIKVDLYRRIEGAHFASALLLCLSGARMFPAAESTADPNR